MTSQFRRITGTKFVFEIAADAQFPEEFARWLRQKGHVAQVGKTNVSSVNGIVANYNLSVQLGEPERDARRILQMMQKLFWAEAKPGKTAQQKRLAEAHASFREHDLARSRAQNRGYSVLRVEFAEPRRYRILKNGIGVEPDLVTYSGDHEAWLQAIIFAHDRTAGKQ